MGLRALFKLLLIGFCALFLIAGVAITAVAIWTIADKVFVSLIIGTDLFSIASYFLLIGGIIIVATSILGVLAVLREKRLLLIIFFVLLIIIFLCLFICAIMAVVLRGELEDTMKDAMTDTLRNKYGGRNYGETTAAWDRVQSELRCCGVTIKNWEVYTQTPFYDNQQYEPETSRKLVPASCCVFDERINDYPDLEKCQNFPLGPPGNLKTDITNHFLYYGGCYQAARTFLLDQSGIVLALGFAFAFGMIAGIVLTVLFIRKIVMDEQHERRHGYTEKDVKEREEDEKL